MFSREDFIETNTTLDDTDAFPDLALQLASVKFCILASEDDKGYFRVSFRSKGDFSVNDLARKYYNGGGHLNAAGGTLVCTLDKAIEYLLSVLPEYKELLNK